uniref:Pink-eyed dilution-like protein n=1 Tax=Choanoeca perplexa TaxID=81531 RepID=A0A1D8RAG0_9EUKA|nr:pink-eyed dilution-like protein [Choanoeca perplexa]|eukprot:m.118826 g.118826  ORF g.118826 m.118826 type:complete len:705 (+) comp15576_c0_seq1:218-2332(+)
MSGRRKQVDGLEMDSNRNTIPDADHSTILLSETDLDGESHTDDASETTGLISSEPSSKHESQFGRKHMSTWIKTLLLLSMLILAAVAFGMSEENDDNGMLVILDSETPARLSPGTNKPVLDFRIRATKNMTANLTVIALLRNGDETTSKPLVLHSDDESLYLKYRMTLADEAKSITLTTDAEDQVALLVFIEGLSSLVKYEVVFAALILVVVYVLIIFELIHRALAAMLGAFLTLGVLSVLGKQPPLEQIVSWIDFETVMLLFGMMIIVSILSETGVFEWAAVKAYKISAGSIWMLLTLLCGFSAIVSAFLDNVTTILLLTPVTISMCRVIGLDPTPVLLAEVIFSNIGGTATAVGDPPNVIIVSSDWSTTGEKDIEFTEFTGHMFLGIIFVTAVCYPMLRWLYRNEKLSNPDPPDVAEIKREIQIWQRTKASLHAVSEEEEVVIQSLEAKIRQLKSLAEEKKNNSSLTWEEKVHQLEQHSQIKNKELLQDCCVVLFVVIVMFFVHSIDSVHLDLGWIAILGALCLLLLTDAQDFDSLLERIEWGTLLFFAALFILMEALAELGLIDWIGTQTSDLIKAVPDESRLSVAIVLILWISALASSFIDNIPFTTAMIPVIKSIVQDPNVDLPLRPLVWALAFGACLGGNGTLIGASANVVCAGMAEQEGITISFNRFFRVGFPMMLVSVSVATVYLLICHSALQWDL